MAPIVTKLFFIILFFRFSIILSLTEGSVPYNYTCAPQSTDNINLQSNLTKLFSTLKSEAYSSNIGFANATINAGNSNQLKGLIMCYIDAPPDNCSECINFSLTNAATLCPYSSTATFTYGWCDLRYSNSQNFIKPLSLDRIPYIYRKKKNVSHSSSTINSTVSELLNSLRLEAMNSTLMYAISEKRDPGMNQSVYGLVQCTRDLHPNDCSLCVQSAIGNLTNNFMVKPPEIARALSTGCYVKINFFHVHMLNFTSVAPALNFTSLASAPGPSPPNLPPPTTGSHSKIIIIVVVSTCLIFMLIIGFAIWLWRRKRTNHNLKIITSDPNSSEENGTELVPRKELRKFDLRTLRAATNNFSKKNMIGKGGFGVVYKATLPTGEEIAVKMLEKNSKQGGKEFDAEVNSLAALNHRNLVKLVGYCKDDKELLLCYEYLPNGSLDKLLFGRNNDNNQALNWMKRYKIAQGISRGLRYVHEESIYKIVHRDLKPANILLDKDLNTKISDFGTAMFFTDDLTHKSANCPAYTPGYVAPECLQSGEVSFKSDVYSFGIILLEIVTGQKNTNPHQYAPHSIIKNVVQQWVNGTIEELKDPNMGEAPFEEIKRCIQIGLCCLNDDKVRRPTMKEVNLMLEGCSEVPPITDAWLTSWIQNVTETDTKFFTSKT